MRTEAERLLLDLIAQLTIAPRMARHSTAFEDALSYFDEGDVDEAVEAAAVPDHLGDIGEDDES